MKTKIKLFLLMILCGVTFFSGTKEVYCQQVVKVTLEVQLPGDGFFPEEKSFSTYAQIFSKNSYVPKMVKGKWKSRYPRVVTFNFEITHDGCDGRIWVNFYKDKGSSASGKSFLVGEANYRGQMVQPRVFKLGPVAQEQSFNVTVVNWNDSLDAFRNPKTNDTFYLYSPQLKKNFSIEVYLPSSYKRQSKKRYPVIFALDGEKFFDYPVAIDGGNLGINTQLEFANKHKFLPEAIVVGIYSNDKRKNEYDFNKAEGKKFQKFLVKTLRQYIHKNYPAYKRPSKNYLVGISFGGAMGFATLWKYPQYFSKGAFMSFSGLFIFNDSDEESSLDDEVPLFSTLPGPKKKISVYFDYGDRGNDVAFDYFFNEFEKELSKFSDEKGIENVNYEVYSYEGAEHCRNYWRSRLLVPLKYLLSSEKEFKCFAEEENL